MQTARSSRVHNLIPEMHAPPKHVILTNAKNKIQLNAMLTEGLLQLTILQKLNYVSFTGELKQWGEKESLNCSCFLKIHFLTAIASQINKRASFWSICEEL